MPYVKICNKKWHETVHIRNSTYFDAICSYTILMNKVRNKETNEQMHGRNIRSECILNQGHPDEKPIP